jgi:hypothetical protein
MGERGRLAIEIKYNWTAEAEKLTQCYRRILREDAGAFRSVRG